MATTSVSRNRNRAIRTSRTPVTAKADDDMRREIGKISDSYVRREAAALEGVASHSAGQAREEMDRLQAALMEKVLQSERVAMALDEQKLKIERRKTVALKE